MIEFNTKTELLCSKYNFFPARKVARRPATSCKNFQKSRDLFKKPVQQIQIVTSSNFVVRKHKPIANPFAEFTYASQPTMKNSEIYRTKLKTLNNFKFRLSFFRKKGHLQLHSGTKEGEGKKANEDFICGWG